MNIEFVKAKNQLATVINKLVPELEPLFKNIKYKNDFTPCKKDYEALKAVADKYRQGKVRIFFEFSEYSQIINMDIWCKTSTDCCAYIKDYHFFSTEFKERKIYTLAQILSVQKELNTLQGKIRELKTKESSLKLILEGF